jgi:hypothetical protein
MKPFLTSPTVKRLIAIVSKYKADVPAPILGNWMAKGNGELWGAVLGQIAVVGSSASGDAVRRAVHNWDDWYASLAAMESKRRLREIHRLLREAGVRYAAKDIIRCKKSAAANYNFSVLASYGGPKTYFEKVGTIPHDVWRVAIVADDLSYIKNKGARDLLIGLGLVECAVAFDTRLKNILEHLGAQLPNDLAANTPKYKALEAELIEKVCVPSKITGGHLDRILFSSYEKIVA